MSTAAEKAADLADLIADDPITVTVYRRTPGGTSESSVGSFNARIDQTTIRIAMDSVTSMGMFTRQNYVMVYSTDEPDVRNKDEVRAAYSDSRTATFRVLSFHDHGWKKEAIMEKIN